MTLEVEYKQLPFTKNYCIGFFLFEGHSTNCKIEAKRLTYPNGSKEFIDHLPILLLACRTHMTAMFGDPNYTNRDTDDQNSDILVLWLTTVATKHPLRAIITASNQDGTILKSMEGIKVKTMHDSHVVEEILIGRMNYLMVNAGALEQMSSNDPEKCIKVSVTIIKE